MGCSCAVMVAVYHIRLRSINGIDRDRCGLLAVLAGAQAVRRLTIHVGQRLHQTSLHTAQHVSRQRSGTHHFANRRSFDAKGQCQSQDQNYRQGMRY